MLGSVTISPNALRPGTFKNCTNVNRVVAGIESMISLLVEDGNDVDNAFKPIRDEVTEIRRTGAEKESTHKIHNKHQRQQKTILCCGLQWLAIQTIYRSINKCKFLIVRTPIGISLDCCFCQNHCKEGRNVVFQWKFCCSLLPNGDRNSNSRSGNCPS